MMISDEEKSKLVKPGGKASKGTGKGKTGGGKGGKTLQLCKRFANGNCPNDPCPFLHLEGAQAEEFRRVAAMKHAAEKKGGPTAHDAAL